MAKRKRTPTYEYRRKPKRHGPSSMFFGSEQEARDAMAADRRAKAPTGTPVGIFLNGQPVEDPKPETKETKPAEKKSAK